MHHNILSIKCMYVWLFSQICIAYAYVSEGVTKDTQISQIVLVFPLSTFLLILFLMRAYFTWTGMEIHPCFEYLLFILFFQICLIFCLLLILANMQCLLHSIINPNSLKGKFSSILYLLTLKYNWFWIFFKKGYGIIWSLAMTSKIYNSNISHCL